MTEAPHPDEVRDAPQTSSNQARTEPIPPSPAADPPDLVPGGDRTGEPATVDSPGDPGSAPTGHANGDTKKSVAWTRATVPSPGFVNDEHGHVAVSTYAAQGTSEESGAAEGIRATAIAQPGKPDGEVAT